MEKNANEPTAHSYWGKKALGGYAGLSWLAPQIMEYVPHCEIYVEPFAGHAKVAQLLKFPRMILNDRSDHSNAYCRRKFPNAIVENKDFVETIRQYDSPSTFFLIDPPWRDLYKFNELSYQDREVRDYYTTLFGIVPSLQGNWIICSGTSRAGYTVCKTQSYYSTELCTKDDVIFGKPASVFLLSNLPFTKRRGQSSMMKFL